MARKKVEQEPEVEETVEVQRAPGFDLTTIEGVTEFLQSAVCTIKGIHGELETSSHPVARSAAAAIWGAIYGLKRDLGNNHGIKLDID
jgi:hypothetical protein